MYMETILPEASHLGSTTAAKSALREASDLHRPARIESGWSHSATYLLLPYEC